MPAYRILIFRAARLESHREIEAESDIEALQKAASMKKTACVELWREASRLATFRPSKAK